MKTEYKYTENMDEISGFGGGYEDACRNMVIAGIQWCDKNIKAEINFKEYKNIYGLTFDESNDCKKMQKIMLKAANNDCTGAMMQAALSHIMFIRKNGWDKYVLEMNKKAEGK